jgi:hypothetical protein
MTNVYGWKLVVRLQILTMSLVFGWILLAESLRFWFSQGCTQCRARLKHTCSLCEPKRVEPLHKACRPQALSGGVNGNTAYRKHTLHRALNRFFQVSFASAFGCDSRIQYGIFLINAVLPLVLWNRKSMESDAHARSLEHKYITSNREKLTRMQTKEWVLATAS